MELILINDSPAVIKNLLHIFLTVNENSTVLDLQKQLLNYKAKTNILLILNGKRKIQLPSIELISQVMHRINNILPSFPILAFEQQNISYKLKSNQYNSTIIQELSNNKKYLIKSRSPIVLVRLRELREIHPNYIPILYIRISTKNISTLEVRTDNELLLQLGSTYEEYYNQGLAVKRQDGVIYDFNRINIFRQLLKANVSTEDVVYLDNLGWFDGLVGKDWQLQDMSYTFWAAEARLIAEIDDIKSKMTNFATRMYWSGELEKRELELQNLLVTYLQGCRNGIDIGEAFGLIPKNVSGFIDATYPESNLDIINDWINLPIGGGAIVVDGVGHGHSEWKSTEGVFLNTTVDPLYETFISRYLNPISRSQLERFEFDYNKNVTDSHDDPKTNKQHNNNSIFAQWNEKYLNQWGPVHRTETDRARTLIDKMGLNITPEEIAELNILLDSDKYGNLDWLDIKDEDELPDLNNILSSSSNLSQINENMMNIRDNLRSSILYIFQKSIRNSAPSLQGAAFGLIQPLYTNQGSYLFLDNYADVCTIIMEYVNNTWRLAKKGNKVLIQTENAGQAGRTLVNPQRIFEMLPKGAAFITFSDGIGEFLSAENIVNVFNASGGDIDRFRQLIHIEIEVNRGRLVDQFGNPETSERSNIEEMATKYFQRNLAGTKKWNIKSAAGYDDISVVIGYLKPYELVTSSSNNISGFATPKFDSIDNITNLSNDIVINTSLNSLTKEERKISTSETAFNSLGLQGDQIKEYLSSIEDTPLNKRDKTDNLIELLWDRNVDVRRVMLASIQDIPITINPVLSSKGLFYNNNNYLTDVYDLTTDASSVIFNEKRCEFKVNNKTYIVHPAEFADDWYSARRAVRAYANNINGQDMCDNGLTENIANKFVICSFTDGNGPGTLSKLAAETANNIVISKLAELLKNHLRDISSRLIFMYQDQALMAAQQEFQRRKGEYGMTCIQIWTVVNNFLCLTVLGDTKTYIVSQNLDYVIDVTAGIRSGDDVRDPGGRIGAYSKRGGADLRNYLHILVNIQPGDYILSMSDGIDDNLQPKILVQNTDLSNQEYSQQLVRNLLTDYQKLVNGVLFEDDINLALMAHVRGVTKNRKLFLLETKQGQEPEISAEYPGKLDHAGLVVYHHI